MERWKQRMRLLSFSSAANSRHCVAIPPSWEIKQKQGGGTPTLLLGPSIHGLSGRGETQTSERKAAPSPYWAQCTNQRSRGGRDLEPRPLVCIIPYMHIKIKAEV